MLDLTIPPEVAAPILVAFRHVVTTGERDSCVSVPARDVDPNLFVVQLTALLRAEHIPASFRISVVFDDIIVYMYPVHSAVACGRDLSPGIPPP